MSRPYHILNLTILPLMRWRIHEIVGLEHLPASGGYIIVANHQSWIDSGIVAGALYGSVRQSLRAVAQSSKYRIFGGIPINEYNPSSVLDVALGYLRAGHPTVIFPEGNSNPAPELRLGKTGAARLALRSGLPVVPMGIQGTTGVTLWQSVRWFFSFGRRCRVVIGQPIIFPPRHMEDIDRPLLESTTADIMQAISTVSGKPYTNGLVPHPQSLTFYSWLARRVLMPLLQWRVRVRGEEYLPENGPFIVVGNHNSYFDAPTVTMALYRSRKIIPFFLTKRTVADAFRRIFGPGLWSSVGMIPLDTAAPATALDPAASHLRHGGVIGIFPEGTRNKPSINPDWQTAMLKGKTGLARLWLQQRVPVIPSGIQAPEGIGIGQALIGMLKFWRFTTVTFGPPVDMGPLPASEPTKSDLEAMTRTVMQRVAELCQRRYPY